MTRDLDKQPYSADEKRVAKFFFDLGTGGGDDPIGAIIASHAAMAEWNKELRTKNASLEQLHKAASTERDELQQTFDLRWAADMRAIKRWQAAHPGKESIWPDHADLVVWLLAELEKRQ